MLDKLKAYGAIAAALVLAVLLVVQTGRLQLEQTQHQALKVSVAQDLAKRTGAALTGEQRTATKERTHAASTQENADEFTISQPVRDAIARAEFAAAERLRLGAERRAATYYAQAQADAAACRDLADRHATYDAHIVRGAGVVAGLRADLGRRDAEVKLLRDQIDADRALLDTE
jgi:hypothetical protein